MSTTCEAALRSYFAAFDGTKKQDFSDVEPLFDALFSKNFTLVLKDHASYVSIADTFYGMTLSRDQVKDDHANKLSKGTTLTLIHFRKIGLDCVDVQFALKNEDEDKVIRAVFTIEDNKIVKAVNVDDTFVSVLKAKCSSAFHTYHVSMNKYQTNM